MFQSLSLWNSRPDCSRGLRRPSARQLSEGKKTGDFDEAIASIALDSIREIVARDGNVGEVAGLSVVGWWSGGVVSRDR